jgi:formylglycine-generating enzyme required for sulfatase activity
LLHGVATVPGLLAVNLQSCRHRFQGGETTGNEMMKIQSSKRLRSLFVLCWAMVALGPQAPAQPAAALNLQLYAGLNVTGAVGSVCSVEYVTDLAHTNSWGCLEFLQLPASPYLWTDKSAPATGRRFYRAAVFSAPAKMAFIPPGTFRMGSPTNEMGRFTFEGPQTAVTISRGFWMGKYEVTQGEYLAVMGGNPSSFTGDSNRPVEQVSWQDATNYCDRLTQRERAAGRIPTNSVYRLPTEAQWEYACRGWTSARFSYGDDVGDTNLANHAWYQDNSGSTTHPVGQKLANPWGLCDLSGNVFEWCQDWYDAYPGGIAVDPQGPERGSYHVIRGGDWGDDARLCRSAYRDFNPDYGFSYIGFRVVLASGQP